MKKCNKCNENKPLNAFGVRSKEKDGLNPSCKECIRKQDKKYYFSSRKESMKLRNQRKEVKEYNKQWIEQNKDRFKENRQRWNNNNKEKIKDYSKTWSENNKEKIKDYSKKYFLNNKDKIKEKTNQYYLNNKEKVKKYNKNYNKEQYKSNIQYKLSLTLRNRFLDR